jgi:SAM-dependent methyltransferase
MCHLYIIQSSPSAEGRATFLDIAPAGRLGRNLRSCGRFEYRSADFAMPGVDDEGLDLQDMSRYRTGQFDRFLCSHVLEHVPDDRRAMSELHRVLKPGGWGIAMVPISLSLETTREDPSVLLPRERTRLFGQSDHVRLYAKRDFVARLENAGFVVEEVLASSLMDGLPTSYGIHPRSVLYVCHKR